MKSVTIKKIIKFAIAAVLIGVVVFFGIKLLFPQPDKLDVYNKTFGLSQNENYTLLAETSESMITLMSDNSSNTSLNQLTYSKLKVSDQTLTTLQNANVYTLSITAFANNSKVYDSNAKVINSLYGKINSKYDEVKNYITTYVTPFLTQPEAKTISSINSYSNALLTYEIAISNMYLDYNNALANVISDESKSITNNEWSLSLFRIQNAWAKIQVDLLNSDAIAETFNLKMENVTLYNIFTTNKLTTAVSEQFYSSHDTTYAMLVKINSIDVNTLLQKISTAEEPAYISSITDETVRATTSEIIAFIKGE